MRLNAHFLSYYCKFIVLFQSQIVQICKQDLQRDDNNTMKFPNQKTRQQYQNLLDKQAKLKTQLRQFENQIQQFETTYFEKHWNQGNVVLGWPKVFVPPPPHNAPKIKLVAKDKPFSLSSTTSRVNLELQDIMDKNLTPYPENRFQTTKKRKTKKGNPPAENRKRIIRRRRR